MLQRFYWFWKFEVYLFKPKTHYMKKLFLITGLMAAAVFSIVSCKKEDDSSTTTSGSTTSAVITCTLNRQVRSQSGSTNDTTWHIYNSSNKVIQIKHDWGFDTIIYNSSGQLSMVKEMQNGNSVPTTTYSYTYTGNNLTQIIEKGTDNGTPYTKTSTITYNSSNLPLDITTKGDPDGKNLGLKNIIWSGNNPISADLDFDGTGTTIIECTISTDGKKNIKRFGFPANGPDHLNWFCSNITAATTKNAENLVIITLPAGSKIIENTYSYNSNNEVTKRVEIPNTTIDPGAKQTIYDYTLDCK